jgi:hypothetical protein
VSEDEFEPEVVPVSKRSKKTVEGSSSRTKTKAAASRGKAPMRRSGGAAPKKPDILYDEPTCEDWKRLDVHEYFCARAKYNPYAHPRSSENPKFWCEMQEDIYQQVIQVLRTPVVEQHYFNMESVQLLIVSGRQ